MNKISLCVLCVSVAITLYKEYTKMDYDVRTITSLSDVSQLVRIHNTTWHHSLGIIDLLENASECFLLVERGSGKVAGYLFLETDSERGFVEINDLAIDPAHRQQGGGRMLMQHALAHYDYLKLNADATNQKLIDFYWHLGFKTESVLENYYAIDKDALRMVWRKRTEKIKVKG